MESTLVGITMMSMLMVVGVLGVLVLGVIALASGRGDPDTDGKRAYAVYLGATSFVALFAVFAASYACVSALADLVVDEDLDEDVAQFLQDDTYAGEMFMGGPSMGLAEDSRSDRVTREALQAGLVTVFAGVVLYGHSRLRRRMVSEEGFVFSAAWRADRAYLFAVCFVTVVIVLFSASAALYDVFRMAAPGVTSTFLSGKHERQQALAGLLSVGYLSALAAWVFKIYWLQVRLPGKRVVEAPATGGDGADAPL